MIFSLEAIRTWHPELDWWRKVFFIAAIELLISGIYLLNWTAAPDDVERMAENCATSVSMDAGQRSLRESQLDPREAFFACMNETSGLKRLLSP